jgi:hypothetical protein
MRLSYFGLIVIGVGMMACGDARDKVSAGTPPDAGPDASPDAGRNTLPDAGPDASLDAGPDAPTCTKTMCGDACVDLMTSVGNCGSCGHVCGCGSTSCTTGMCDAHVLAAGQGAPVVLALHDDKLYWGNDVDRTVSTVPIAGGAASVLYPDRTEVRGFAFDATRVYFSRFVFNIVESAALDGSGSGNFTNQQEAGAAGVATDATNAYWATYTTGNIRTRVLGPPNAAPSTTLATNQAHADGVAVDAASIYWTTNLVSGAVLKMPKVGGAPVPLATAQANPHSIAVDAGYVYWTNQGDGTPNTGSVNRVPLSGGTVTTYADHQPSPYAIAIDTQYVYWTDDVSGSVMRAPLQGGAPISVAVHEASPMGLVVSSTCLYFADYADGKAGTGSIRSHDLQ